MFKDIKNKLNEMHEDIKRIINYFYESRTSILDRKMEESVKLIEIIHSQQETINQLLKDKYIESKKFECVVIVPHNQKPFIVRNGNRLDNDKMTSFDIDWVWDSGTSVTINYEPR